MAKSAAAEKLITHQWRWTNRQSEGNNGRSGAAMRGGRIVYQAMSAASGSWSNERRKEAKAWREEKWQISIINIRRSNVENVTKEAWRM